MTAFATKHLPMARNAVAPDGSDVRLLCGLEGGGLAHSELAPGETAVAVSHRTVEEIWFSFPVAERCGGSRATGARRWMFTPACH
jgi:hypothetical protein